MKKKHVTISLILSFSLIFTSLSFALTKGELGTFQFNKPAMMPDDVANEQAMNNKFTATKTYESALPEGVSLELEYTKYLLEHNYIVTINGGVNIRRLPSTEGEIIRAANMYEKLSLLGEYEGEYISKYDSNIWYMVKWEEGEETKVGYMLGVLVEKRTFEFDKALEEANKFNDYVSQNNIAYISNYKNWVGSPPYINGSFLDKYGNRRYQSSPAYYSLDNLKDFIYLTDGSIISIVEELTSYYKVHSYKYDQEFYVPRKYVSFKNQVTKLNQVIVVDRINQNQMIFSKGIDDWSLVSFQIATTGADDKYRQPTDLGYYKIVEKKDKFLYLDDITRVIDGYAPYALRFNGGAYIHGVPVQYKKIGGQLVDPGMKEILVTLGTVPRSHKCIRNYNSHAEFLYNWINLSEAALIVMD